MRILFMGTPDIAAACLRHLLDEGREVVGVVCQPDKPKGRGNKMLPPPTKELALERGVAVYQPYTLKDGAFEAELKELSPDIIIVVAYGKILPSYVLNYPRYGCINLHVSLLPAYRGAAPMQRAIMAGEAETGVTVMYMDEGLDTGDIISVCRYPIEHDDDYGKVTAKAAAFGAPMLSATIDGAKAGTLTRTPQPAEGATYAPKIEKPECKIDFSHCAKSIDCLIRALSPAPFAFCRLPSEKLLKVPKATPSKGCGAPGTVLRVSDAGEGYITVACGDGAIDFLEVVPEGKNRMSAAAFVRGRGIKEGDILL